MGINSHTTLLDKFESDMEFLGIVGVEDSIREGVS